MATADFTISKFQGSLKYGGARPSLFDISITGRPTGVSAMPDMTTQCQVSAIPGLTVTPIERQYFGRTVKIPGDMVFADLSTTIINTESFSVRAGVEIWMDKLNGTASNYGFSDSTSGYGTLQLTQYNKEGDEQMGFSLLLKLFRPIESPTNIDAHPALSAVWQSLGSSPMNKVLSSRNR